MTQTFLSTLPRRGDTLEIIRAKFLQAQTDPKKVYLSGTIVLSTTNLTRGDTIETAWIKRLQRLHDSI